jgi:RNA polymerase sigma-70 factor (ECF subfamily)
MDDTGLLIRIIQGNEKAFSLLFKKYYKDLVLFGGNFLPDKCACEDIVQSIFLRLWNEHQCLHIETSLKSYLLKSVQNACLDEIQHRHVVREHEDYTFAFAAMQEDMDTENYILYSDLQQHLQQALDKIPVSYREAFELNRFEGLKFREIADKLQVSQRTVEVRIGKTIALLRKYLKDFMCLLWMIC